MYVAGERYVWVECEEPGYEGFRAEVRQNLTQGERTLLRERLAAIEDRIEVIQLASMDKAQELDERTAGTKPGPAEQMHIRAEQRKLLAEFNADVEREMLEQHRLIAPYVRAWNLYRVGEDGEPVAVPAPRDGGDDVFDLLERPLVSWLIYELLVAYRGGKGLSASVTTSDEQQAPTDEQTHVGPQVIDMSNTRASRRKSNGR